MSDHKRSNDIKFSIVTNVSLADKPRIDNVLTTWPEAFDQRCDEILIVIDAKKPTGRILRAQKKIYTLKEIRASLDCLCAQDRRIKLVDLDYTKLNVISLRWFGRKGIDRNQSGTPIFAFLFAIENARNSIVMKSDCDMLFHDNGWVIKMLESFSDNSADAISPPRINFNSDKFCGQVAVLNMNRFNELLPLKPFAVDLVRRVHRRLNRRPIWLAYSEIFEANAKRGLFRHEVLSEDLGFSLHTGLNSMVADPQFLEIREAISEGFLCEAQRQAGWTLDLSAWS